MIIDFLCLALALCILPGWLATNLRELNLLLLEELLGVEEKDESLGVEEIEQILSHAEWLREEEEKEDA